MWQASRRHHPGVESTPGEQTFRLEDHQAIQLDRLYQAEAWIWSKTICYVDRKRPEGEVPLVKESSTQRPWDSPRLGYLSEKRPADIARPAGHEALQDI